MKSFSFDVETNGLWGRPFAIGALVHENGKEIARYLGRCPIDGAPDEWASEHIIPGMILIPENHKNYYDLLKNFSEFYLENKKGAVIIAHVAFQEFALIRDMHDMGFIGDWDAPFPLIDVAGMLHMAGKNPTSVDDYAKKYGISADPKDYSGGTHSPLYDSAQTAAVYTHLS